MGLSLGASGVVSLVGATFLATFGFVLTTAGGDSFRGGGGPGMVCGAAAGCGGAMVCDARATKIAPAIAATTITTAMTIQGRSDFFSSGGIRREGITTGAGSGRLSSGWVTAS